jgi:hypothetical protein
VPETQLTQLDEAKAAVVPRKVPIGHNVQLVLPVLVWYAPTEQLTHELDPVLGV